MTRHVSRPGVRARRSSGRHRPPWTRNSEAFQRAGLEPDFATGLFPPRTRRHDAPAPWQPAGQCDIVRRTLRARAALLGSIVRATSGGSPAVALEYRPDAPLITASTRRGGRVAQFVMLDATHGTSGLQWQPTIFRARSPAGRRPSASRRHAICSSTGATRRTAGLSQREQAILLSLSPAARRFAVRIGRDGAFQGTKARELKTTAPIEQWTSLTMERRRAAFGGRRRAFHRAARDGDGLDRGRAASVPSARRPRVVRRAVTIAPTPGRLWVPIPSGIASWC